MPELKELREKRQEYTDAINAIVDKADNEKRNLTNEELDEIANLREQRENADRNVKEKERQLQERMLEKNAGAPAAMGLPKEQKKINERFSFARAIVSGLEIPGFKLDGLEAEMHQEAISEAKGFARQLSGIGIPGFIYRAAYDLNLKEPDQIARPDLKDLGLRTFDDVRNFLKRDNVVSPAGTGGETVQTNVQQIIPHLFPRAKVMDLGATMMTGLTANMQFPNGTTVPTSSWKGEITALAKSTPGFSPRTMTPKRLGTYITESKQLLIQSVQIPSIEAYLIQQLRFAQSDALDFAAIQGSGIDPVPEGILGYTGLVTVPIGATGGLVTHKTIVDLERKLEENKVPLNQVAYLTSPGVRAQLKTTMKGVNSHYPVWEDDAYRYLGGGDARMGEGIMNGYRAAVSGNIPTDLEKSTSGTILHAIILGCWDSLMIGQWGGLDIIINPFSLDTTGQVRITVDGFYDMLPKYETSFVACVDANPDAS